MKITSRTEYGLRAMVYLANRGDETPAPLAEIDRDAAEGERPPERVAVYDVVTALEGPLTFVECVGTDRSCVRADGCASRVLWRRLDDAVQEALEGVSLADLVAEGVRT